MDNGLVRFPGEPRMLALKNLPSFCRVAAKISPTTDSDIKIEVWMPLSGWNGKLEAVGNGGWAAIRPNKSWK